ncbi:MAG: transcription antitermination factor NusB [Saprospiraceae bacterium]|nr:transcription antitermination factor NusB [Saprospiraceae bacterium]
MQLLYSQSRDAQLTKSELLRRYDEVIELSFELFLYALYILVNVTYWAKEDEKAKRAKHLPTDHDKAFTAKLYTNPLVRSLDENQALDAEFIRYKFRQRTDEDFFKKMYVEFSKLDVYEQYVFNESTQEDHINVLLELFRFLRKNEYFNDVMADQYATWQDDKSLVVGTMKKVIKDLPSTGKFFEDHFPDAETAQDYGKVLLREVVDNEPYLLSLIEPTLKNWDADRLAIIDMILLKMALCEFLFFPTIPTKVTLNEYVEVSKLYSTPKSKDFINGILDRLMKSLEAEGKINKEGRGLIG